MSQVCSILFHDPSIRAAYSSWTPVVSFIEMQKFLGTCTRRPLRLWGFNSIPSLKCRLLDFSGRKVADLFRYKHIDLNSWIFGT